MVLFIMEKWKSLVINLFLWNNNLKKYNNTFDFYMELDNNKMFTVIWPYYSFSQQILSAFLSDRINFVEVRIQTLDVKTHIIMIVCFYGYCAWNQGQSAVANYYADLCSEVY